MHKITEAEVKKIATLARLELNAAEIAKFSGQLDRIIEYVDTLNEVNIDGVEPFSPPANDEKSFRPDRALPCLSRESALQNAPQHNEQFFIVPGVIK